MFKFNSFEFEFLKEVLTFIMFETLRFVVEFVGLIIYVFNNEQKLKIIHELFFPNNIFCNLRI